MEKNIKVYQKNEVICREGVYENWMYDIRRGGVRIILGYGDENEQLLATLEAGQYFGEIGLTDMVPRTATALAAEDNTKLAIINESNFKEYFHNNAQTVLAIMRNMSERLRGLTVDYIDVCKTIAEAADAARHGLRKSEGLKRKLSKILQEYIRPAFVSTKSYRFNDPVMVGGLSVRSVKKRTFHRDEAIFRQGDPSSCMYDINWGRVGIYINYGSHNQKLLTELEAEEFFGEMGIIDNAMRSATAVALEDNTEVKIISSETFADYMDQNPDKVLKIMRHLGTRIRELTQDYSEACRVVSEAQQEENLRNEEAYWQSANINHYIDEYERSFQEWENYSENIFRTNG